MIFTFIAFVAAADTVTLYGCGKGHEGCLDPDPLSQKLPELIEKNIIIIDANYNGDNAIVIDFLQDSVDTLTFINCTELDVTCSAYVNIIMGEGNGGAFVTVRGSDEYQSIDKYKKYGAPVFFKKNHQVNTFVFEMETTANLQTARICSYENLNKDGKVDDNFSPPRTVLFSVAGSQITTGKQQTPYITPDDVKITLVSYEINPGGGLVLDSSACIGSSGSCKSYESAISVLEKTIVNIFELTGDKTSRDLSVTPSSTMTKLSLREMAGSLTVKSTDIKISTNNNQDFALKLIGTGAFQEKSTNIYDKAQCYLESSSHGVSKIEYTINDDPSEFYAAVYEDSADFHVPDLTIAGDKGNFYSLYSKSFSMIRDASSGKLKEQIRMKALYFSKNNDNAAENPNKKNQIPPGGIAGIVIAVIVIIAAVVGSAILLIKIKNERKKSENQEIV